MNDAARKLWESPDGLRLLDMWLSDLPKEEIQRRNEVEFKPLWIR